jgi:cytochrome c
MSAHPQLTLDEASQMVKYILSITDSKDPKKMLPLQGSVSLKSYKENEPGGVYTLTAKYTDKGTNSAGSLSDSEVVRLRSAKMRPIDADMYVGIDRWGDSFGSAKNKSYVLLKNVDLTGIKKITYEYNAQKSGEIEVRLESFNGPLLVATPFSETKNWDNKQTLVAKIEKPVDGRHHLFIIFVNKEKSMSDLIKLWTFEFGQ